MPASPALLPSSSRPWYQNAAGVVLLHLLLLAALTSALYAFGIIRYLPAEDTLMRWDVLWYDQIRQGGYQYSADNLSNSAFFPLFPYFWRVTGLGLLGMGLLNASIFLVAAAWLAHRLQVPFRLQLLWLSTPSFLFMIVPYTEALFFAFAALVVVGVQRRQLLWWILGLLGCGLSRSASTMFTPALLFMVLLWATQPGQLRRALVWGATGLLTLALTVGVVAFIQWKQVGEPFAFALAQKHWGHFLQWPRLYFNDPSGTNVLWLDATALWWGVAAIGTCCWLAWRWLQHVRRRQLFPAIPPEVVFSLGYCVCVCLFMLSHQGGSMWNFGRYVLATPFFLVVLNYVAAQPAWPRRYYALLLAGTLLLWQVFGIYTQGFDSFTTPQAVWYFGLVTAYLAVYVAWRQLRWQREATMLLYVFNLVVMLHLLDGWLQFYVVQ
ncbi:hypothetical protein [Hymenobacter rigui]|uniref:DUF2029 domain-containing protein n=1 Tax=Hymenobacter rigui TaxID=334424 RepID=A0A3R9PD85_9BACT|nr:hypothetical protein [Hymenobacter rigui]RSK49585.1 hypothetical protein EI291_08840 [Hymenobacter rigui]